MMFFCRHKPREVLKNHRLDFWPCCATLVSLEEFETRLKFGPAPFLTPNSLGKHPPHPQTAAEDIHLVNEDLEFSIPSALPPASPQPPVASSTHKLVLHLMHSIQLTRGRELVLGQAAALQGIPGEGSPKAGLQHQQQDEAKAQHFANESPMASRLR